MLTAKIRSMSRRRRKIAIRRKMRALLRAELSPFIGQRLGRETLERMEGEIVKQLQALAPRGLVITSARLVGDMLHMTINPVPPVEFINVTQAIGGQKGGAE